MARELSRLEKEIYSIGRDHLPKHPHEIILKEWDFYGKSRPYGKLVFSCPKCSIDYPIELNQEEQLRLFNLDSSTTNVGDSRGRYFTL